MAAEQSFVDLPPHSTLEGTLCRLIEDFVHEAACLQLFTRHLLAHDQRLVRFGDAHPLHEADRCATLGDETKRREWCEEVCGRRAVDEVAVGNQRGRETDDRAVQGGDEDFGVAREGASQVDVVREEAGEILSVVGIRGCRIGGGQTRFDICAAKGVSMGQLRKRSHAAGRLTRRRSGRCR